MPQHNVLLLQILNGDFLPTDNLYFKGMTLARCFRVLDSVVLAILIYLGALAFKRVVASEKNQLAYCIQVGHLCNKLYVARISDKSWQVLFVADMNTSCGPLWKFPMDNNGREHWHDRL